jgi:multimeric flavodoxin WrbA
LSLQIWLTGHPVNSAMTKLLAINGSYRENGAIDQAIDVAVQAATQAGTTVEIIYLRNFDIEFCLNCRHCTQVAGEAPGECVHQDRMHELVAKIEAADGYILASPTNFYSVTALFKRFMERLVVYAYWPWGAHAPKFRKRRNRKRAILIASSAAPGIFGRLFYATLKQLKMTAKTIGAKSVSSIFIGLMSQQEHPTLSNKTKQKVRAMVNKLV